MITEVPMCPDSLNGKHESEEAEVENITETETTLVYFCSHCGTEGHLTVKNRKIVWDKAESDSDPVNWDEEDEWDSED
jgi:hypothetical protein